MKNGRLIIAIITSLLDEALIIGLIIWGLPHFGIKIPVSILILICIAFVVYAVLIYITGSKALIKNPVKGLTDLVGMEGQVIDHLNPDGMVKINSELWIARAETGNIENGVHIVVLKQEGLKLIVRRR
jgi:membrane-bound ClpP family serine protease